MRVQSYNKYKDFVEKIAGSFARFINKKNRKTIVMTYFFVIFITSCTIVSAS